MKILGSACLLGENCKYSGGKDVYKRQELYLGKQEHHVSRILY